MAGFYSVPFASVAPKAAETAANLVKDSFMDVAKCIRARIYAFMNVPSESREVLKVGEDKKLDKILEEYLKLYKNMGKSNVSRIGHLFTLFCHVRHFVKFQFFTLIRINRNFTNRGTCMLQGLVSDVGMRYSERRQNTT